MCLLACTHEAPADAGQVVAETTATLPTDSLRHTIIDTVASDSVADIVPAKLPHKPISKETSLREEDGMIDIHRNLIQFRHGSTRDADAAALENEICEIIRSQFERAADVYPHSIIDAYPNSIERSARPDVMQAIVTVYDVEHPTKTLGGYNYQVGLEKGGNIFCRKIGESKAHSASGQEGNLVSVAGSGKVYFVLEGKRLWVKDQAMLSILFSNFTIVTLVAKELSSLPEGQPIAEAYLCKGSEAAVYLVLNGVKRHILNENVFNVHHFAWDKIRQLSDEDLAAIPTGKPIVAGE